MRVSDHRSDRRSDEATTAATAPASQPTATAAPVVSSQLKVILIVNLNINIKTWFILGKQNNSSFGPAVLQRVQKCIRGTEQNHPKSISVQKRNRGLRPQTQRCRPSKIDTVVAGIWRTRRIRVHSNRSVHPNKVLRMLLCNYWTLPHSVESFGYKPQNQKEFVLQTVDRRAGVQQS